MNQKEFIKVLIESCSKMMKSINENKVWNLNDGMNYPEEVDKSSVLWRKFINDMDTYFSIYEDDEQQKKANALIERSTIDTACIEDIRVFLHSLENELLKSNFPSMPKKKSLNKINNNDVFIVHGHDETAKQTLARTLALLGYKPIILHEQASGGKTIIEKIEEYSNVAFAIVLYTPCDVGRTHNTDINRPRARQNVVFEHGYLIGKLGRERVSALVKGDVETPGDISGVVYTKMDDDGAWKISLVKEMKKCGLSVDMNQLL